MSIQLFFLALSLAFAVGLVVWMGLNSLREVQEEAEEQYEVYSNNPLFKALVPLIQSLGRGIAKVRTLDGFRKKLLKKLTCAGKNLAITPDEFIGYMLCWGVLGVIVALYFEMMIPDFMDSTLGLGIVLLTIFLPYLQLNDQVLRRQKAIRKILPYTLDLLCLAVEAGLDFTAALNRIGENLKQHPFREELRLLSRDLSMGKTRGEALRDMERRIGLEELTSVVSALVQADELGSSLGGALRIQSQELQRVRFQRAEKKAMQAPVLMLIPLVLFIFPLVFMVIFTPIALRIYEDFPK